MNFASLKNVLGQVAQSAADLGQQVSTQVLSRQQCLRPLGRSCIIVIYHCPPISVALMVIIIISCFTLKCGKRDGCSCILSEALPVGLMFNNVCGSAGYAAYWCEEPAGLHCG
jgi:hypothetical protein